MKVPFFPFNSLHQKTPISSDLLGGSLFLRHLRFAEALVPGDVEMVDSGRIGCKVQPVTNLLLLRVGFFLRNLDHFGFPRILFKVKGPGPHVQHPKSPGLQVSLNGEMTRWFSDLEKPWRKPGKNDQSSRGYRSCGILLM